MRRRREDELRDIIGETLKSEAKGVLALIVGLVFKKLIALILKALKKVDWIDLEGEPSEAENPV